ncbi:ubiquitin-related modifier 1 [Peziza echinospora]|nr:ubiquitin-related modifier 1 [Peziza echinospora]
MASNSESQISITVEFSGGLELMFSKQPKHHVKLPSTIPGSTSGEPTNIKYLLKYLCDELMTDTRKDLFVIDETVRPGVLVLINDSDWELEGEEEYVLQNRDNILFVSTLHGG